MRFFNRASAPAVTADAFIPPKPHHPEHNPVPVPQRARKSARQILREMSCRLEGFIIGGLIVGALLYPQALRRGEDRGIEWAAIQMAEQEQSYQYMGDREFAQFEREAGRVKR